MKCFELRSDASEKFWTIDRRGASITVCWGRIGTKGQSKTKLFDDAAAAKKAYDALILEKTGKGYRTVSTKTATKKPVAKKTVAKKTATKKIAVEKSAQKTGAGRKAVAGKKGESLETRVPHLKMVLRKIKQTDPKICDRIGGSPNLWSEKTPWPICKDCDEPLFFVLQLRGEKAGGKTRIGKASALQLFVCRSEHACCFYEPRSGAHHVALRRAPLLNELAQRPQGNPDATVLSPLRFSKEVTFEKSWDDPEGLEDADDEKRFEAAHHRGFVDKLYGIVACANEPESVTCIQCGASLEMLAQVLSADDWFAYFLHTCPSGCEVVFQAMRA